MRPAMMNTIPCKFGSGEITNINPMNNNTVKQKNSFHIRNILYLLKYDLITGSDYEQYNSS